VKGARRKERWKPDTLAVIAGRHIPTLPTPPLNVPIHQTSVFVFPRLDLVDDVWEGETPGYFYSRYGNPTVRALEEAVAALEGGEEALVTSSGMSAIFCALASQLEAGDVLVTTPEIYGGTRSLLAQEIAALGVTVRYAEDDSPEAVAPLLPGARVLYVETLSNPNVGVCDLPRMADLARQHRCTLVVDNTFATPCLVQPLGLGATLVVHSATKYLDGHSQVTGGVLVGDSDAVAAAREVAIRVGVTPDPFGAWLILRGLRTLAVRWARQCDNAMMLARFLSEHPAVSWVSYPGLPSHRGHDLARRLFAGGKFGAMLSFELREGKRAADRFVGALQLCRFATTLGDVCTVVSHPASTSHRSLSEEEKSRIRVTEGVIRVSVGIEDPQDLCADFAQALQQAMNC